MCRQYLVSTETKTGNMLFNAALSDKLFYLDTIYKNNDRNEWFLLEVKFQNNFETMVNKKINQIKQNLTKLSKLKRDITLKEFQDAYMVDDFSIIFDNRPFNELIEFWNDNKSLMIGEEDVDGLKKSLINLRNISEEEYAEEIKKSGDIVIFDSVVKNTNSTILYFSDGMRKIETEIFYDKNRPYKIISNSSGVMGDTIYNSHFEGDCQNQSLLKNNTIEVKNKNTLNSNEKKSQEQTTKVVTVKKNNLDKKSLKEELKYWKELFEEELITKAEYDQKRKELLEGGVQETKVITTKVEEPKKEVVKKIIKPKIDMSYKNKNYLYPKIDKKFNAWSTEKIINRCMSDFRKTLEAIMCMQKNIRATNRYKKGGRGYMDLYNLHITASGNVEDAFLNGHISESEGKTYLVTLNSQIINALNVREAQLDSNKPNGDALIQLGQEMMKPGFDWSTGKATNNSQSNSSSFYSCVLKAPLSGIGSGLKGSSIGTIECN